MASTDQDITPSKDTSDELMAFLESLPADEQPDTGFEDRLVARVSVTHAPPPAQTPAFGIGRLRVVILVLLLAFIALRLVIPETELLWRDSYGGSDQSAVLCRALITAPRYLYLPGQAGIRNDADGLLALIHNLTALYVETFLWLGMLWLLAGMALAYLRRMRVDSPIGTLPGLAWR